MNFTSTTTRLGSNVGAVPMGFVTVAFLVAGCERDMALLPPEIRYGEDMCAACGMIVSDDRFAAALIRDTEARRETLVFDDIGCLFLYRKNAASEEVLAEFVRDADGAGWLELADGFFVHSTSIETPMAFGIAAYTSETSARSRHEQVGGTRHDDEGLRRWIADDPAALDPFGVYSSNDDTGAGQEGKE